MELGGKKKMEKEKQETVTFLKICGDCGRKFKNTFVLPDNKKECMKIMSLFWKKYDLACNKCSKKYHKEK